MALYSRDGMVLDQAALERGPEPVSGRTAMFTGVPNTSEANRAKNRRVEIVFHP